MAGLRLKTWYGLWGCKEWSQHYIKRKRMKQGQISFIVVAFPILTSRVQMKTEEAICCAALQVCGSNRLTIFPETQISWDAISANRRGKGGGW